MLQVLSRDPFRFKGKASLRLLILCRRRLNNSNVERSQTQVDRIQHLQNTAVETLVPAKISGQGIKATPAYETPLSKHEVTKWRKEFWETRTTGNKHIWTIIRTCCEEDHETAEALILASGLQMPQNSLTLVVDEQGVYYRVPICMINDPMNYDADFVNEKLKLKQRPDREVLVKVSTNCD